MTPSPDRKRYFLCARHFDETALPYPGAPRMTYRTNPVYTTSQYLMAIPPITTSPIKEEPETDDVVQTGPQIRSPIHMVDTSRDIITEENRINDGSSTVDPLSFSSHIKEEPITQDDLTAVTELGSRANRAPMDVTGIKVKCPDDITMNAENYNTPTFSGFVSEEAKGECSWVKEGEQVEPGEELDYLTEEGDEKIGAVVMKNQTCEQSSTFECFACDYQTTSKRSLKQHVMEHSGGRPYACSACKLTFTRSSHLTAHERIHSGEKPYACDICNVSFSQVSNLKSHMKIHTGEKPFVCDVCQSKFSRANVLKIHKRIHSGEKPFACDVCQSRFHQASHLKVHKLTHAEEKPFKCDLCDLEFSYAGNLKRHMVIHSGEKPFVCVVCDAKFRRAGHLRRHELIHSGTPHSNLVKDYSLSTTHPS